MTRVIDSQAYEDAVFIQTKARINVGNASVWRGWHRTACALFASSRYSPKRSYGDAFLFSLPPKSVLEASQFRLNHCLQMDYFDDAFHTFLCLDSVIYLAVNGTQTTRFFIQNILNCVLKTNEAFTGLERHAGKVIKDKMLILGWSNPLIYLIH